MNLRQEERAEAMRRLSSGDVAERRAAAEYFRAALWERQLIKKDVMVAVSGAMTDADEIVALTAARAVIAQRWRYGDMDRILVALEADLPSRPELAPKVMEIAQRIADPKALAVLASWLVEKLASADPADRAVARTGLANLAHVGTDLSANVPALVAALSVTPSTESEAIVELLYLIAGAQADTRAAEPVVERWFGSDAPPALRYRAARLVTVGRFGRGDGPGVRALTTHRDAAVREGAVDALGAVRRWTHFALIGVPLLGARLTDEAGGVMQGAALALLLAARDGVDLSQAEAAIMQAIAEDVHYRSDGRVFPLDMIGASDLRHSDAVADLAEALVLSDVRHRSLEVLAARPLAGERAQRGAQRALATLEQDPALLATVAAARLTLAEAAGRATAATSTKD